MLKVISDGIPEDVSAQLLPNEQLYYFSYISFEGGCGSSSARTNHWIALTDKRVLYRSKITENGKTVERNGIIPMNKVSFMEATEEVTKSGCSSTRTYFLRIGSSGGTVNIPVPTPEKSNEIRRVYAEMTQTLPYLNQGDKE